MWSLSVVVVVGLPHIFRHTYAGTFTANENIRIYAIFIGMGGNGGKGRYIPSLVCTIAPVSGRTNPSVR